MPRRQHDGLLARFGRDVRSWGDPISRELGVSGELLVARIRLGLVALLVLIPIKSVLFDPAAPEHWIGLTSGLVALLFATVFLRLARRPLPPRWLPMTTSQFDVAVVSAGSAGFVATGAPLTATNSLVHYSIYFVALAATGLRYDPRVCVAAGSAAVLQHGAIVAWVVLAHPVDRLVSPLYGAFSWDNQIGRLELLAVATLIQTVVVARARRFWLASMRDRLTGLYNRGFFEESLERAVAPHAAGAGCLAVALADLDHFKRINDEHGHAAGDAALRRVAEFLRRRFRDDDLIARFGGEEFALLVPGADSASATHRLETLRAELAADPEPPRLTVSIGVAFHPAEGVSGRALLETADRRLYAAKRAGRDRVQAAD